MMPQNIKSLKEKIAREEARLIRLKKQGYDVEKILQKVKEIKVEIAYVEARYLRVSRQSL